VPCFALTNPNAGSDAASIPDFGIVCMGEYQGKSTLGLKLTWEKRYHHAGAGGHDSRPRVSCLRSGPSVGNKEDLGITCALIPTHHPGVNIGHRHMPLNAVFPERAQFGQGRLHSHRMGHRRQGAGRQRLAHADWNRSPRTRYLTAFVEHRHGQACGARDRRLCRVRTQFKTPIGKFEGVEEALARMGGNLYMMDATRM